MRIVIKIGTSTITHPTGRLNIRQMEALCIQFSAEIRHAPPTLQKTPQRLSISLNFEEPSVRSEAVR